MTVFEHKDPRFTVRVPQGFTIRERLEHDEVNLDYGLASGPQHSKKGPGRKAFFSITWQKGSYEELVAKLATEGVSGMKVTSDMPLAEGTGRFVILEAGDVTIGRALAKQGDRVIFCESDGPTPAYWLSCKSLRVN